MQRFILSVIVVSLLVVCLAISSNLYAQDAASYNERGTDFGMKGDYDKAIADFDQALRINPNYADAYHNRGLAWAKKGDYGKAIADFDHALRINPNDADSHYHRGLAWEKKGHYDEAIADFNQALRINPKYVPAYNSRGGAWEDKGDYAKAIADYEQAVRLDRHDAEAYNDLAWIQATCPDPRYRDGKKALGNAKQAYQLSQGNAWDYLDTFAAVYAENGDFQKAREWQEKAIAMCAKDKDASEKDKQECRSHLAFYQRGKPYHEELRK